MTRDKTLFKFSLTTEEPEYKLVNLFKGWWENEPERNFKVDKLVFQLIEISKCNPSDLKLTYRIRDNDPVEIEINLYTYRTKLIFQDGFYLLDISEIEEFNFDMDKSNLFNSKPRVTLTGKGEVTFYGYALNPTLQR